MVAPLHHWWQCCHRPQEIIAAVAQEIRRQQRLKRHAGRRKVPSQERC